MPLIDKQRLMGSGQVTSASVNNEGTFHPKQISGLNQWYDASDASTLTTASIVVSTTSSILSSPLDIASCSLWLDADDASSMTLSGTNIQQWNDKSGNGNHYGQTTLSAQPTLSSSQINGRDVVAFTGDAALQTLTRSATTDYADSNNKWTTFLVVNQYKNHGGSNATNIGYNYGIYFSFGLTSTNNVGSQYIILDMRGHNGANGRITIASYGSTYDNDMDINQATEFIGVDKILTARMYTSGTEWRITGSFGKIDTSTGYNVNENGASLINAARLSNTVWGNQYYGEIIHYNRGLTDAECALVETYLDNKWGVTVATQSYTSTSNITSSVLTQWQDKSGNALHLTASSTASAPVLSANEIYSYSAVQFSGTVSSSNPVLTASVQYGTPFTPASVSGSSLVMWYDASDASSVTLNGTGTLQWRDKSGNNNHAGQSTAAAQPVYDTTNTLNGLPVMRFDNQAHFLSGTHGTMGNNENTVFLVAKIQDTGSYSDGTKALIGWGFSTTEGSTDSDGVSLYYYNVAYNSANFNSTADGYGVIKPLYPDVGGSSNPGAFLNHKPDELFHSDRFSIHAWRYQQGNHKTNIFGREAEHTTGYNNSNDSTPGTKFRIGNYQHYQDYAVAFSGSIAEVIVYDSYLSDADRASVETYLQNKWNITVTTQSSAVLSGNYDPAYPTQSVSTEAKSIVSIIKQDNANSGSVWAFVSGSEYDGTLITNEGGNTNFAYGGTTETSSFTSPFSNSTSSVVTAIWGGGYSKLYKDGTLLTSSQNNTTLSSSAYLALGKFSETNTTPWYPTSIASCSLWLDADDASSMTVSGTSISEWRNKSVEDAGLFDCVQSTANLQPITVANEINNKTVVRFSGDNTLRQALNFSGSSSRRAPAGSDGSITSFIVGKYNTNPTDWHHWFGYGHASGPLHNEASSVWLWYDRNTTGGGTWGLYADDGWGLEYSAMNTTASIFSVAIDSSNHQIYHTGTLGTDISDGETYLTGEPFYPSSNAYIYGAVGGVLEGSYFYGAKADIAEIICFSRKLTAAERTTVETYLQNKWGITVATQSSDIDTDNTLTGSISTYWSGSIGEMLVYNKAISDKERTRAENYLQQKWRTSGSSGTGNGNGGGGGYP